MPTTVLTNAIKEKLADCENVAQRLHFTNMQLKFTCFCTCVKMLEIIHYLPIYSWMHS